MKIILYYSPLSVTVIVICPYQDSSDSSANTYVNFNVLILKNIKYFLGILTNLQCSIHSQSYIFVCLHVFSSVFSEEYPPIREEDALAKWASDPANTAWMESKE